MKNCLKENMLTRPSHPSTPARQTLDTTPSTFGPPGRPLQLRIGYWVPPDAREYSTYACTALHCTALHCTALQGLGLNTLSGPHGVYGLPLEVWVYHLPRPTR